MGIPIPTEYGGAGSDYLTHVLACGRTVAPPAPPPGLPFLSMSVSRHADPPEWDGRAEEEIPGPDGQRREISGLRPLPSRRAAPISWQLTTTATLDGDAYVVNGTKTFTSNGPTGDTYLVFGLDGQGGGPEGMSCFIIPKGTAGMSARNTFPEDGAPLFARHRKWYSGCRVPKKNLLGKEGAGIMMADGRL